MNIRKTQQLMGLLGLIGLSSCAPSISTERQSKGRESVSSADSSRSPLRLEASERGRSLAFGKSDATEVGGAVGGLSRENLVANKNTEIDEMEALIFKATLNIQSYSNQMVKIQTTGRSYVRNGRHLQGQLRAFEKKINLLEVTLNSSKELVKVSTEKTKSGMKVEYKYGYCYNYSGAPKKITVGHTGRVKRMGEEYTKANYDKVMADHERAMQSAQSIDEDIARLKTKLTELKAEKIESKALWAEEGLRLEELNSRRGKLLAELLALKQ